MQLNEPLDNPAIMMLCEEISRIVPSNEDYYKGDLQNTDVKEISFVLSNDKEARNAIMQFLKEADFSNFLGWRIPPEISLYDGKAKLYARYCQTKSH